ncbi:MAG: hypothetical protein GF416_08705 [Candidatus Altiarchaeales archaeon]|nr:hypothetical protein [Candidatus Altiarchaeales archaeon]MBD3417196.1 hypothetical protein [Candidatus Altiarchaeales archaeon]
MEDKLGGPGREQNIELYKRLMNEFAGSKRSPKGLLKLIIHAGTVHAIDASEILGVKITTVNEWIGLLKKKRLIEVDGRQPNPRVRPTKELLERLKSKDRARERDFKEDLRTELDSEDKPIVVEDLKEELLAEKKARARLEEDIERVKREEHERSEQRINELEKRLQREEIERSKVEEILKKKSREVEELTAEVMALKERAAKLQKNLEDERGEEPAHRTTAEAGSTAATDPTKKTLKTPTPVGTPHPQADEPAPKPAQKGIREAAGEQQRPPQASRAGPGGDSPTGEQRAPTPAAPTPKPAGQTSGQDKPMASTQDKIAGSGGAKPLPEAPASSMASSAATSPTAPQPPRQVAPPQPIATPESRESMQENVKAKPAQPEEDVGRPRTPWEAISEPGTPGGGGELESKILGRMSPGAGSARSESQASTPKKAESGPEGEDGEKDKDSLLKVLLQTESLKAKDAASMLGVDEGAVKKWVDELAKANLVEAKKSMLGSVEIRLIEGVDKEKIKGELEAAEIRKELKRIRGK